MSWDVACDLADLDDLPLAVTVGDVDLAIVRVGQEVFAIHDECSHGHVQLSEGDIDPLECSLECYLHGSTFDLRTGRPLHLPATEPVPVYPARIEGSRILVDVTNPITATEEN